MALSVSIKSLSQVPLVQDEVVQNFVVEVRGDTFYSKQVRKVKIKVYRPMTFIQTDKPIYLPGQTGNFELMGFYWIYVDYFIFAFLIYFYLDTYLDYLTLLDLCWFIWFLILCLVTYIDYMTLCLLIIIIIITEVRFLP